METQVKPATFSFKNFRFNKVYLDLPNLDPETTFNINFAPSGIFIPSKKMFQLTVVFSASIGDKKAIEISCISLFEFEEGINFDSIPEYFYGNSIAIVFPYIRSFISTMTLQANMRPIVLPIYNMVNLKSDLIENTVISDAR